MQTYNKYLKTEKSLTIEEMESLYQELINDIGTDEEAKEFWEDFLEKAIEYAQIRLTWDSLSHSQKLATDFGRTSKHNSVIVKLNVLSRYLQSIGKECSWRDKLGYEKDNPYNRKRVGDFVCYIGFIYAINAR